MKTRNQFCSKTFSVQDNNSCEVNYLDFYRSQWQINPNINIFFVLYRIAIALIFSITLIVAIIDLDNIDKSAVLRIKWMIYLTNWHFSTATLQSVLSAYLVISMYLYTRKHGEHKQISGVNKTLCGVYLVLYTIAINGALFVSLIYWTMVYDEKQDPLSVVNIFTHAVNAILLLIDCFIVAHSVRFKHFYLPLIFNITYVVFSIMYFVAGGTNKYDQTYIYSILDWNRPLYAARNIAFVFITAMVLHALVCMLVLLRRKLASFLNKHENNMLFPMNLMEPLKEESVEKEDSNHNQA